MDFRVPLCMEICKELRYNFDVSLGKYLHTRSLFLKDGINIGKWNLKDYKEEIKWNVILEKQHLSWVLDL